MPPIPYNKPAHWLMYDEERVRPALIRAEAEIRALRHLPYIRDQVEVWQAEQLKREAAGTSRIEGAEFTDAELDAALDAKTPAERLNHSQRQARAAKAVYRWISVLAPEHDWGNGLVRGVMIDAGMTLDPERPVDGDLIRNIHRRIVKDCDDDHCEPGALRGPDHNVSFGIPPHRGAPGGADCARAFDSLMRDATAGFRGHPPLVQAHALHYHIAAMHPFGDGNGRTARAAEAFMLQKAGWRGALFIAVSNYYHENKKQYLEALGAVRQENGDLTPFLLLALEGVRQLCEERAKEISKHARKALFRGRMRELYDILESPRKRVLAKRQILMLEFMLEKETATGRDISAHLEYAYKGLRKPTHAMKRDLNKIMALGAVETGSGESGPGVHINLHWPEQMSTREFQDAYNILPRPRA